MNLKIDTLRKKIFAGFSVMAGLLVLAIGITSVQISNVSNTSGNLTELYHPSSVAGSETLGGVNYSIAYIRETLLLGRETDDAELDGIWDENIRTPFTELETLSLQFENVEIVQLISSLGGQLDDLHSLQEDVLDAAELNTVAAIDLLETDLLDLNSDIRSILYQLMLNLDLFTSQTIENINKQVAWLTNIQWGLLLATLLVGSLMAVQIMRSVTEPIENAVSAANRIASGDLDKAIEVRGSREAEVLGNALESMRRSLKKKTEENRIHDWLTTGQNRLNDKTRGDQDIEELANSIIHFIAEYTGSVIGALYLHDESRNSLVLTGRYAFSSNGNQERFGLGEGVIGQVAVDKTTRFLDRLEEQQIRIKSTLVDTTPKFVLVTPFIFDGVTLGVIELGKLDDFKEAEVEFVESNMENVGILVTSAISNKKVKDLLEETQLQSEELQQQQEELEQNNEELEEQTQYLKEQQEELRAANEELEEQSQVVEMKNQDLEKARTEIESKAEQLEISSKYKSEFLANMSHELRTPLNSLLILSNDLLKNKHGNLNDEELESTQVIAKSGRDLLTLINEILDLSKIEAGKMVLNASDVNIQELADDMTRNFKVMATNKGLGFEVVVDEALPESIHTDRQRLEQILKNLLSNALKFTESGKIGLKINRNRGGFLSMSVCDSGIGIPKEKQVMVFEAFQQAEGGTARKYGGTGLGLSISRELAKLLGGRISLESTPGEGSVFTLVIPFLPEALSVETTAGAKRESPMQDSLSNDDRFIDHPTIDDQRDEIKAEDHVILIIEDDHDFARILAKQAIDKGFRFIAASTGEDGLILAEQYRPAAIILDLVLPGIDGHLVLKELKGNPDIRHIPVHIISSEERTLDPIKAGAVQYFPKPVTQEQLNEAFSRIEDFVNRKMKNLLVVEDNATLRKSIIKLIGNGDVECLEAGTASEAIECIRNQTIDCIVLDIGLPDMSGFEFIKKIEGKYGGMIPPIIVYTGKELSKEENDELQEYAETIIVKGIKSEERLLDETALFLHRTVSSLPVEKQKIISSLYDQEKVFVGKKLLLVDDDMRNVFALSKVLKEKGFRISKAENGQVALNMLEQDPDFDLVLMDIMMPEMDGYECMKRIRGQKRLRELPIIALTAKAMNSDRQKCIDAGANDYITKPVDVERLLSLMRIWIRK